MNFLPWLISGCFTVTILLFIIWQSKIDEFFIVGIGGLIVLWGLIIYDKRKNYL